MNKFLRILFFFVIVKPFILVFIGLNIRNRTRLPLKGPALLIANHNSHLDALVLLSLFDIMTLNKVQPVAAADFFLRNKIIAWFALKIIGILPIDRRCKTKKPLSIIENALADDSIIILFPEGTRGKPEEMSDLKNGVWHIANKYQDMPVIPVFLYGLGKALPKGEGIFVPSFCDVFVGNPVKYNADRQKFMQTIKDEFKRLTPHRESSEWW